MPDPFWTEINDQLSAVSKADVASFTAVRDILLDPARTAVIDEINRNGQRRFGPHEAFFAGSGGDDSLAEALHSDWKIIFESEYQWTATHRMSGSCFEYIEGDLIDLGADRSPKEIS